MGVGEGMVHPFGQARAGKYLSDYDWTLRCNRNRQQVTGFTLLPGTLHEVEDDAQPMGLNLICTSTELIKNVVRFAGYAGHRF